MTSIELLAFVFIVPSIAVVLDSFLGDPAQLPHPVRFIGMGLDLYEAAARKVGLNLKFAGWFAVFVFSVGAWSLCALLVSIPVLGWAVAVYLGYAGLALGCLIKDSRRVASLLDTGDIDGARSALAMLVSRDTSQLDSAGVRRTLAETLSENINDGFVAPLFYLTLLGPGGMWAYKTVSTMDSMWGYRTERFIDLGNGAARVDDWLAFIPARITARLLLFAAKRQVMNTSLAEENYQLDAVKMESPNAGWPMAAAAWILKGQMGGRTVYFGETKEKPILGPIGRVWDKSMIRDLLTLCRTTGQWAGWILIPTLGWFQYLIYG